MPSNGSCGAQSAQPQCRRCWLGQAILEGKWSGSSVCVALTAKGQTGNQGSIDGGALCFQAGDHGGSEFGCTGKQQGARWGALFTPCWIRVVVLGSDALALPHLLSWRQTAFARQARVCEMEVAPNGTLLSPVWNARAAAWSIK